MLSAVIFGIGGGSNNKIGVLGENSDDWMDIKLLDKFQIMEFPCIYEWIC